MGNNAAQSLGSRGRQDAHMFFPEDLTLIVGTKIDPKIQELADAGHLNLLVEPGHFLYDPRADMPIDSDLGESLHQDGILQPIRVMKDGDRKLIVVGRQRVKAAALINAQLPKDGTPLRIPALIYRSDEAKAFKAVVVENEMRTQDPPSMRAMKMQRALDLGLTKEDVCRIFKIGAQQLSNMVKLIECAPEVRKAVDSGTITATLAYTQLAKLERTEQVEALKELKASGETKGSAATDAVKQQRAKKDPSAPAVRKPPRRKEVEGWIETLKGTDDPVLRGVRMGLMKALGFNPKGWGEVKLVLEAEE
jgi:ParB-like chromosome segregation protein Spo0J